MLTIVLIGLVGGLITGISPCVLPVLPVLFFSGGVSSVDPTPAARGRKSPAEPARNLRPYLIVAGLTVSFSVFTLLGTVILDLLPVPKDSIRWAGLALLVVLGIAMIFPAVERMIERPFSRLGARPIRGDRNGFVLGLALGAVYVPCAGPVLAAITVAGATGRIGGRTIALTLAFAVGTAIPLLIFALAGRAVGERVRTFRDHRRQVQTVAGVVIIALAVGLAFNVTDVLQRSVPDYTTALNGKLEGAGARKALAIGAAQPIEECAQEPSQTLTNCGRMPSITGISSWLNTPGDAPLSAASLRGKVVLIDFWAYSCINCQRAIPHVEAWYSRYRNNGLVVIGVHTPEYAFEHVRGNVSAGAERLGITYPVALDNGYSTWNHFHNQSWPAEYLVDSDGRVRHVAIGEGDYTGTEGLIRQLLSAARPGIKLPKPTDLRDTTPTNPAQTPETYLGAERAATNANSGSGSDGRLRSGTWTYGYPPSVPPNGFAFAGTWTVAAQSVTAGTRAGIKLDYNASNVYLDVGGTGTLTATVGGKTTTYHVAGAPNIYTVAHSSDPRHGHLTLTLSAGLQAYSFTFG